MFILTFLINLRIIFRYKVFNSVNNLFTVFYNLFGYVDNNEESTAQLVDHDLNQNDVTVSNTKELNSNATDDDDNDDEDFEEQNFDGMFFF